MIVGAFVLKNVLALVIRRWQLAFMAKNQVEVQARLLEGYLTGPYAWHLVMNTSDKLWSVGGAVTIGYTGAMLAVLALVSEALTILFIFVALLVVSPIATAAAALYFGLAGLVVQRGIRPRILVASRKTMESAQAVSKASLQSLTAVKEIKLRQAHQPFVDAFAAASEQNATATANASLLDEIPKYFLEIVFVVGVGLLAVGAAASQTSDDSLALIGVFVAAGTRVLPSAIRLTNAHAGIRFSQASLTYIIGEHRQLRLARDEESALRVTTTVPQGDVTVRDLRFAYGDAPDQPVLHGVDMDFPAGPRLRSSVPAEQASRRSSTFSSACTARGRHDHRRRDEYLRQPARVAGAARRGAPGRYPARRDPGRQHRLRRGGGRRAARRGGRARPAPRPRRGPAGGAGHRDRRARRATVGRAAAAHRHRPCALPQPAMLVLDEATSALDNETQRRLTQTIESLTGTMTMVIVAHRLSTVRHCDQLIFMRRGGCHSGHLRGGAASNAEFAHLVALGEPVAAAP